MLSLLKKRSTICTNDSKFKEIADKLLNKTELVINDKRFRICEVEFYLHCKTHLDEYTHCDDLQQEYGKLYFHRFRNGVYKSGTYKCMDLTLGDRDSGTYLGILIRSIRELSNGTMYNGPCKSVDRLLREFDCESVKDLEKKEQFPIDMVRNKKVRLVSAKLNPEPIYIGPRIGLSDKYPEFHKKLYRYVIMINDVKKEKTKLVKSEN